MVGHTWLVRFRVLFELAHKAVKLLLPAYPVFEGAPLELWVVSLVFVQHVYDIMQLVPKSKIKMQFNSYEETVEA
jgi:hypothetical protein